MNYDPAAGGAGFQSYFADMVLDSDRNAKYFEAIRAMIAAFRTIEGRAPVVLDAGCGSGLLTLFAIVAGAHRVIAVDVDEEHTRLLKQRLGEELAARVTVVNVKKHNPFLKKPCSPELQFDAMVSELLGTFSNSESAHLYLRQYAQCMHTHASGAVYAVPKRVRQTLRRVALPRAVDQELRANWKHEYAPTEQLGWLFEHSPPAYLGDPVLVREDRFHVAPFQTKTLKATLPSGAYVAEWEATLWKGGKRDPATVLSNTWKWHYEDDTHSKHARARAWGLMLLHVHSSATVDGDDPDATMPPVTARNGAPYELLADGSADPRFDALRYLHEDGRPAWGDYYASLQKLLDWKLRRHKGTPPVREYAGRDLKTGFISMREVEIGIPRGAVPLDALFRCTLGALVAALRKAGAAQQWLQTLDFAGVLPFLFREKRTTPYDVPISMIPPCEDAECERAYLAVGSGFLLQPAPTSTPMPTPMPTPARPARARPSARPGARPGAGPSAEEGQETDPQRAGGHPVRAAAQLHRNGGRV